MAYHDRNRVVGKRYYLILGPSDIAVFERYLGRKVVEGERLLGSKVAFSKKLKVDDPASIGS